MKISFAFLACSLCLAIAAGCGGDDAGAGADAATPDAGIPDASPPDAPVAPALFTPVELSDAKLAEQALALLGHEDFASTADNCSNCHGVTRQHLSYWRAITEEALSDCLTDLAIQTQQSAKAMVDCLRAKPIAEAKFQAPRSGIFSIAAHLGWFEFLFARAYGDGYETELGEYIDRVGMPRGSDAAVYTQDEVDIVATWFTRGLPLMDETMPNDPRPNECVGYVGSDVIAHVEALATTGWRALNAENSVLMHGCVDETDVRNCLSEYPRAQDTNFGVGWEDVLPGHVDRVLFTTDFQTAFWTKSSADGRYVASGRATGETGAAIIDLADQSVIDVNAFYDPVFFPDNSGFIFQKNDAHVCDQSVLSGPPASVSLTEPECFRSNDIGLYEHGGTSLNGTDYWTIDGQFRSDNGGHRVTDEDPSASFSSGAFLRFVPLTHNGTTYETGDPEFESTRFEGDSVMSPSATMIVSRFGNSSDAQLGYVIRRVLAAPDGSGGWDIELPELARYCLSGGKPSFSLDEQWLAFHHYVGDADAEELGFTGPSDPGFQAYRSQGAANVYLLDIATGETRRVTNMNPGQYALFPHFRADGWLYYQVRNVGQDFEYVVASDAALMLETTL